MKLETYNYCLKAIPYMLNIRGNVAGLGENPVCHCMFLCIFSSVALYQYNRA